MGLGLHDDADLSLRALEVASSADRVFAEFYTSGLFGARIEDLEARLGRPVEMLDREKVEQDPEEVLTAAGTGRVAFLTAGDPMAATTHVDLRLRALERGIETRVVHGASVITGAFSELGLSVYKSGRTTTVEWPHGDYFPTTPYETIRDNLMLGLHTLALMDIRTDEGRYMSASEGCALLLRYEEVRNEGVLNRGTLACVVARAGAPDCLRIAAPLAELVTKEFGPPLHCIVIPGKLHFMEARALQQIAGADPFLFPSEDEG